MLNGANTQPSYSSIFIYVEQWAHVAASVCHCIIADTSNLCENQYNLLILFGIYGVLHIFLSAFFRFFSLFAFNSCWFYTGFFFNFHCSHWCCSFFFNPSYWLICKFKKMQFMFFFLSKAFIFHFIADIYFLSCSHCLRPTKWFL